MIDCDREVEKVLARIYVHFILPLCRKYGKTRIEPVDVIVDTSDGTVELTYRDEKFVTVIDPRCASVLYNFLSMCRHRPLLVKLRME